MHPTAVPGNNWTNTSGFTCIGIHDLPFHGTEILVISIIYLAMIAMYATSFVDVALKQTWPEKYLDEEVHKRVKKLQRDFPKLMPKKKQDEGETAPIVKSCEGEDEEEEEEESEVLHVQTMEGKTVELNSLEYDTVVSQQPYHASCCIDEDLIYILANNSAYSQVSSFCSSTVRGYALLSTMLPMVGITLGFMWIHNAMIDPIGDNYARYTGIVGYFLVFLTGIVMCGPNSNTVHRNRNILLWDSVATNSWVLKAHEVGIVGFALVPMLGNLWQVLFTTDAELPNRAAMWYGIMAQIIGLIFFEGPGLIEKCHCLTSIQAKQIGIIGEIVCIMASMLTFVQIESYSSAACAQMVGTFDLAVLGAIFGVLATLCVKTYNGAPTGTYINNPSVMLMNYGTPVATSGPVPVLNYNREAAILPIVQPLE